MRTLLADLHGHLKPAKRIAYRPETAIQYARTLQQRGVHAFAVTEHIHAPGFWDMHRSLEASHGSARGRYEIGSILFYPGFELTLSEVVDVLVIGPVAELRRIDRAFPHPLSMGHHPSGEELAAVLDRLHPHVVRIAAHPLRPGKNALVLHRDLRRRLFHAAEINATLCSSRQVGEVEKFAERDGLAITAGADAHTWPQVAAAWTELSVRSDSFDDLFDAVTAARCRPRLSEDAKAMVSEGRRLKARIKASALRLPRLPASPARARVA